MTIYRIINNKKKAVGPAFQYPIQAQKYLQKRLGNSPYLTIKKVR